MPGLVIAHPLKDPTLLYSAGAAIARSSTDVPAIDKPASAFSPVVPNVESMTGGSSSVRNVVHMLTPLLLPDFARPGSGRSQSV